MRAAASFGDIGGTDPAKAGGLLRGEAGDRDLAGAEVSRELGALAGRELVLARNCPETTRVGLAEADSAL